MAALSLWCKFGEYVNYMCQYSMGGAVQKADFGRAHERAIEVCGGGDRCVGGEHERAIEVCSGVRNVWCG